ncbi:MAG: DUF3793 family protein [Lachnospiraceae bacterium]|nr:DUF3793 family protein [Lachnospiraceae bacterium]
MMDRYLVQHCSPTLASLKTANLFTYSYENDSALQLQMEYWNREMAEKGISLLVLRKHEHKALIYVCRKSRLEENLKKPEIMQFLSDYGYRNFQVDDALKRLSFRLSSQDGFPHEIGIFLDYPLGDVIGFIQNAGQNYKCAGCWKVYCNECDTIKTFAKYKKCRDIYTRLWSQGKNILQLTVAA